MDVVNWSADYELGIGVIDKDHRGLFDTIKNLGDQIDGAQPVQAIDVLIKSLMLYVDEHFEREERFLKRAGYPEYAAHKKEHDDFRDCIFSLRQFNAEHSKHVDGAKVVRFLNNWLLGHIGKSDRAYMPYLTGQKKEPALNATDATQEGQTVRIECPKEYQDHVLHFIDLLKSATPEASLIDAAVEKITIAQKERRMAKARELFGKI